MSLVYYLWSAAGGGVVSKHWEHCLPSGELGTTAFSLSLSFFLAQQGGGQEFEQQHMRSLALR